MIYISTRVVLLLALVVFWPVPSGAQEQDEPLVIKVYRVVDLVLPAPNYAYEGTYLPQMLDSATPRPLSGGGMIGGMGGQGMGGMGGGMIGGMGGGMFQVPDRLAQAEGASNAAGQSLVMGMRSNMAPAPGTQQRAGVPRMTMDALINAITTIIEPASWDEVGGPGAISPIGPAIAVRQTPAIQAKVQEFLDDLKRESGTLQMLTIEARWLVLDSGQLTQLRGEAGAGEPSSVGEVIDANALSVLPAETARYSGQITCFNGQTVHLISGRLESVIGGAIPVVGGAQAAYQPLMLWPHLGVLLQITPATLPNGEGVLVDLHSSVTRWEKLAKSAHIGTVPDSEVTIDVDRINVMAQQFATSLRMPLDQPVLVGGITYPDANEASQDATVTEPDGSNTKSRTGLYLVVKAHAGEKP